MIEITKEPNADSRSAKEYDVLPKEQLRSATESHIGHVKDGLKFFADMLNESGANHDHTKLDRFDEFHKALTSGKIKNSDWYETHINKERHHLISKVHDDVNLVDVFEHLVDCVMAALSRGGELYDIDLPNEVLQKAHKNTVNLLKKNVTITESYNILDRLIDGPDL